MCLRLHSLVTTDVLGAGPSWHVTFHSGAYFLVFMIPYHWIFSCLMGQSFSVHLFSLNVSGYSSFLVVPTFCSPLVMLFCHLTTQLVQSPITPPTSTFLSVCPTSDYSSCCSLCHFGKKHGTCLARKPGNNDSISRCHCHIIPCVSQWLLSRLKQPLSRACFPALLSDYSLQGSQWLPPDPLCCWCWVSNPGPSTC